MLANALGSGVLESGALLGYLPALSEQLLGEPLKLPSIATWWLGEPAAFDDAWKRSTRCSSSRWTVGSGERAVFGADFGDDERVTLRAPRRRAAARYVAQEWVHGSQAPVLETRAGAPRAAARAQRRLRVFAVATPTATA
jgi:uncharacterized circularly permuted ATP-grasp superfamily protein